MRNFKLYCGNLNLPGFIYLRKDKTKSLITYTTVIKEDNRSQLRRTGRKEEADFQKDSMTDLQRNQAGVEMQLSGQGNDNDSCMQTEITRKASLEISKLSGDPKIS